jgi:Phosphotransferase enzyme family
MVRRAARAARRWVRSLQDDLVLRRCRVWLRQMADPRTLRLVRCIFNVAVLTDGSTFFKLGYRAPNTVRVEHDKLQALATSFPDLRRHLPPTSLIELHGARMCLRMPALQALPAARSVDAAQGVLSRFWAYGELGTGSLADLPQAEQGLTVVAELVPAVAASVREAAREAAAKLMRWGPAHGDFHRDNLLWHEGEPTLIDFDCVRLRAPQAFDALYFGVEWDARQKKVPWLHVAKSRLQSREFGPLCAAMHEIGPPQPDLMLLFVLDRVGQEAKFGVRIDQRLLEDFMSTALGQMNN